jgi:putative DNA primase/helicase
MTLTIDSAQFQLLEQYGAIETKIIIDKITKEKITVITNINCPNLAKLLMHGDEKRYLVTEDNQEIYIFNGSYYEPLGLQTIKNRLNYYLDDFTTKHRKQEVVDFIKNYEYVKREELEPPANLINLKNGIFDIHTQELKPHDENFYFLNEIPIHYDTDAKIDKIKNFKETLLNLDDITINQEFYGDCLQRDYRFKKALMNVGETNTGKTQEFRLLEKFLGKQNITNLTLHDLCKNEYAAAELYGKYANIYGDIGSSSLRQIQKFLVLTGNDRISARKIYQEPFYFRNYAKLAFSCNIVPDTEVKTNAYYERWLVIEYSNVFDENIKNPRIIEEITTEKEMSGLFNWALEGLYRVKDQRGYSPHRTLEEVKEYMTKGKNPIREFADTYIESEPKNVILKSRLYDCYTDFCKFHKYPIKQSNVFTRMLKPELKRDIKIEEGHKTEGRSWQGIKCTYDKKNQHESQQGLNV